MAKLSRKNLDRASGGFSLKGAWNSAKSTVSSKASQLWNDNKGALISGAKGIATSTLQSGIDHVKENGFTTKGLKDNLTSSAKSSFNEEKSTFMDDFKY